MDPSLLSLEEKKERNGLLFASNLYPTLKLLLTLSLILTLILILTLSYSTLLAMDPGLLSLEEKKERNVLLQKITNQVKVVLRRADDKKVSVSVSVRVRVRVRVRITVICCNINPNSNPSSNSNSNPN
jgi:hypothetical protein